MQDTDIQLDIRKDFCPMTFVKARLLIDKMQSGQYATLYVSAGEPVENLPRSIAELGHTIISVTPEAGSNSFAIRFCKA